MKCMKNITNEWKVNDIVIHKRDGVCKITALKNMNLTGDGEQPYFILVPVYERGTKIYVPANQENNSMRQPLTIDDVNNMIDHMSDHAVKWIDNEKARQREYNRILESGNLEDILPMISTLRKKKRARIKAGRKFHTTDERVLSDAEKMVDGEFAFTLKIQPDEVGNYIEEKMEH